MAQWFCQYLWTNHYCQTMQWHWTWPGTTLSPPTGVMLQSALSLRWWNGGHGCVWWTGIDHKRNTHTIDSFTIVNDVCTHVLHNLIVLPAPVANCVYVLYYTGSACMKCSFPPTSPSRVTTWWGDTSCSEWWRWLTWLHNTLCTKAYMQQALRRNSLTHTTYPHIYCTHALVIYTITCYVRTWDTMVYTYSSHNCIAGNWTSAYDMNNTTVCKYVCMYIYIQMHPLYSSTSLLGNVYLAITKVFSSEGLVL